jgi:hypothetical protein
MSDLIGRLETIGGGAAPGDWVDVVARAERHRSRQLRRRVVIAIAVALLAIPTVAIATHYWDLLSLSATEEEVPLPQGESTLGYVIGDRLQLPGRPPAKLAAPLLAPFLHPETRLVVPAADRRSVVYHSWEGSVAPTRRPPRGAPVLRLFDAETGRDVLLARGAHSVAWRADGVLAYARVSAREWSPGAGRIGHIVVRPAVQRPAVRWSTSASEWSGLAWAGRHLVAQAAVKVPHAEPGSYVTEYSLHAFSGPGRSRKLPVSTLIAVSPDGRFVLGRASRQGGSGSETVMRLVEVATGRVVDTIVQSGGPGDWSGDTIILTTGFAPEPFGPGPRGVQLVPGADHVKIIVLRHSDGKLALERELRLSRDVIQATGLRAAQFYFGFDAPAFVDKAARQFTAELVIHNTLRNRQIETMLVYLTCDRIELRCRRGRSLTPRSIRWSSLVTNPSRPLPD